MAEIAARRGRGGRRRGRARRRRRSRPGARWRPPTARRCCARLADALEATRTRSWRRSRRATPASRSPTRAARSAWSSSASATTPARPSGCSGETIPVAGGVDMTFREPLGVVGLIMPWNFPLVIASWKVAPALAAGNTVVLKPAELTPLTALELEQIALEAGLPEGVLNVVAGPGLGLRPAAGRAPRRRQDRLHRLDRGRARDRAPAPRQTIKRVTLELGGKSANVVFADADLEAAAAVGARARCSATPARTAARARGSWSSARRWTTSWRRWSARSRR